ncbi:MAG TPA: hypothetical protein PK395_15095 [bacterium]|nr:hypothetical protein [bacterium]HQP98100.1 hypothetical protein [bacterium]
MQTHISLRWMVFFLTCLCLARTGCWASAVEMSLGQNFGMDGYSQYPAGAIDFILKGARQVDRGDIFIDMGPYAAVYAVVLDRNTPLYVWAVQQDAILCLRMVRQHYSVPDEIDTLAVKLILIPRPTDSPLPYLGYQDCGFGEFSFLSVNLTDVQGQTIEDVTTTPGSWCYWTDAPVNIYVRVLRSDGITPIGNAKVKMTGFVGGAGISSVGRPTDSEGLTHVMYPAEWGFLLEPPDRTKPRTDVDLRAWFRVESTADTTVRFEPFDTLVRLEVNEDRRYSFFKEVTIVVEGTSAVEDWGLYK